MMAQSYQLLEDGDFVEEVFIIFDLLLLNSFDSDKLPFK